MEDHQAADPFDPKTEWIEEDYNDQTSDFTSTVCCKGWRKPDRRPCIYNAIGQIA